MDKIKNLLSGNKNDENVATSGQTSTGETSGLHSGTTGNQTTGLTGEGSHFPGNRDNVGSDTTGSGFGNTQNTGISSGTTTSGPHSSNLANKADPRIDSDRDGSKTLGNNGGMGNTTSGAGYGQNTGVSSGTTTSGPHSSNLANKADPRIDSDRDGSKTVGNTSGMGNTTSGTGYGQNTGVSSGTTTSGPHSSNLANKADPRIDSDRDGSNTVGNTGGVGNTTSGTGYGQNTGVSSGTTGPHSSNLANKADPRIDSDQDGSRTVGNTGGVGNTTSTGSGYGTGNTTTQSGNTGYSGPHKTEVANRLDPSVNTSGGALEDAHHHSKSHGGGAEEADTHHGARDAGLAAGGVGLAEHEHDKHQNERETGIGGTGSTGLGSSTGAYDNTGSSTTGTGHQSHVGRDAGLAAGGAGLVEHEHHKKQNEREVGGTTGSTGLGSSTGAYDTTGSSTTGSTGLGSSTGAYGNTGSSTTGTGHQSHVGRDAGIGAAGLGAAGVAEHEHSKHSQGVTSDLPGPAPNTAGPHKQDWLNKLDPRVDANPNKAQSTGHGPLKVEEGHTGENKGYDPTTGYVSDPHHHGVSDVNPDGSSTRHANPTHHGQSRANDLPGHDSAAVGALGGAGAYEAEKHHGTESGIAGTDTAAGSGPHSSKLKNEADPTVDSDRSHAHNYGTNAGVAGGVGVGAYEAEKHHQKHDKDLTESEREAKKEHKREVKEEKRELKEEKRELKEEKREHKESKGGLLSFLHRDKNKKYSPEEEAEFDRQEKEHNSHKGRDALAGAGVGGAAYEAEKHHKDHQNTDTNKPLPTAPGNHGIGTGAGTQNALAGDNTTSTSSGHHLGRDAAAVGGAGALGEHERSTHTGTHGATPLAEKPRGTDLGDKLHGVDRNRGVSGPTGFPDSQGYGSGSTTGTGVGSTTGTSSTGQHHYGRDATAVGGAAALGEHEHRKHEHENVGSSGVGNQSSGITGSSTGTGNEHHLGRDTGVAAGGAGLAEHEHRKHEGLTSGRQYDNTTSGLGSSNQGPGSGSEYRKDDFASGQQSGLTGNQSSGLTGNQSSGLTGTQSGYDSNVTGSNTTGGIGGDRNRLHKDPPSSHPAAQGGVPASGTERERIVGQGEEGMDNDTGVAKSHAQGGANAATNY